MNVTIEINSDFITIGQLLKKIGFISTGGQAKYFLKNNQVLIDNNKPAGRSSKVFDNSTIWINNKVFIVKKIN